MKKLTTETFIAKAIEKHGLKYDYSKVDYVKSHTKVIIICNDHGEFLQEPSNHLLGKNCPRCAKNAKHTSKSFIEAAKKIHGDTYGYDNVDYHHSHSKITITCKIHGDFEQTPTTHLNGANCHKCSYSKLNETMRFSNDEFIERAKSIHDDKYDYSKVIYKNYITKIEIICTEHGIFKQSPAHHLSGKGCPKCAVYGFNKDKLGYLYMLNSANLQYVKIGITNNIERRYDELKKNTPFDIVLENIRQFENGLTAYQIEQELHKRFNNINAGFIGFSGASEWFKFDDKLIDAFKELVV